MIELEKTLVSEILFEREFVCNLSACKGACCVEGDAGAPLEKDELKLLESNYEKIKPFLRPEGIKAIAEQGLYVKDRDADDVTTLVEGKECAYVVFEENGTSKCGIERAWEAGEVSFRKPISCHLYPIRISKVGNYEALNYSKWEICNEACALGKQLSVKVYKFLKEAIERKFGKAYYQHLEQIDRSLEELKK